MKTGLYRNYLFDLDGTLIDTAPDLDRALNYSLADAGLSGVDESLTRQFVGNGARVMIEQALGHHGHEPVQTLVDDIQTVFLDYYAQHCADASKPYPEVIDVLSVLKDKGANLGVVTNKKRSFSLTILEGLDMMHFFQCVVGGDTAAQPKPDPSPIFLCLEEMGQTAQDTLFVGDSVTDVNAALNARLPVVCVRDGYHQGVDLSAAGATAMIDTFAELLH